MIRKRSFGAPADLVRDLLPNWAIGVSESLQGDLDLAGLACTLSLQNSIFENMRSFFHSSRPELGPTKVLRLCAARELLESCVLWPSRSCRRALSTYMTDLIKTKLQFQSFERCQGTHITKMLGRVRLHCSRLSVQCT